ncbi:sialin isoform X2 [Anabrus simplex]|uniref:sialin isoform X2 n=1 Tax=Anabrus simplex TaxID=316456 RepID=UPI0035A2DF25
MLRRMEQKAEPQLAADKQGCLRYIVAALLILGVLLSYAVRGMLSVAIVAMVKSTNSTSLNMTSSEDTCPGETEESADKQQDGPFDWDEQLQGEILASYFYGYVATQFVAGWAADKFGGRVVLGPGVLLSGVLSLLCPASVDVHHGVFMANRALQGAFSGVVLPSTHVIIGRWFTVEERSRISGFVLSANAAGNLVALSLSGLLVEQLGWPSVFYVFGGICLLFIVPWIYFVYDAPEIHPRISNREKDFIIRGRQQSPIEDHKVQEKREAVSSTPWVSIMTSLPFWAAVVMMSSFLWINNTLLIQLPSYITNVLHFNIKQSGFISSLPYLVAWLVGPFFGSLSSWLCAKRHISRIKAYRIFNGISCIGPAIFLQLVILLGCHTTAIIVCLVFTAVLQGGFYGGSVTNPLDLAPNYAGTTNGIMLTIGSATGIVAPLLYGAILKGQQTLTGWHTIFYITMAMGIIPYAFFLVFGSDEEQSWNKPQDKKREAIHLTVDEESVDNKC